ncbi:GntR family transcriptional regulator [Agromyces mariniharenae]|uniref:GntR family transcriptional regulator n=1 Tax=Agromyces mariniharenae TaxID=2604423 RepID=A0A5S4V8Q2_9MICO|nr:GntR family transcriptional regulator [Agromyces mariniharenae]TYL54429.1 GntR family transcriptional regulator [Agromyces mariniharenae]
MAQATAALIADDTGAAAHGAAGRRIADALRRDILDGVLAPGTRIRQERLAEEYGASRVPVREAIRALEGEGLVTVVANTGAWVSRLSLAECDELYRVRERIEPLLIRMSIPGLDDADAAELARLADAMESAADADEFVRLDRAFHDLTYRGAETLMLGDTVARLWNRTQAYRRVYSRLFLRHAARAVHHEHHLLVHAIETGDADDAERVLLGHIRRTRLALAKHPEVFDDADAASLQ